MQRGDIVTVAVQGDFGKPRPAVVIQSNVYSDRHTTVLLCLFTSNLHDIPEYRVRVSPSAENGLRAVSDIMVDKIVPVPVGKIGRVIGRLDETTMEALDEALAFFLGLAD